MGAAPAPAALDEAAFDSRARAALRAVEDAFADVDPDVVEVSAADGVVRLGLPGGVRIVINSHRAARQIWMAAVSTAWHFDPLPDGRWHAAKSDEDLAATLRRLVLTHTGLDVAIALDA